LLLSSIADRFEVSSLLRLSMLCVVVGAGLIWLRAGDLLSFLGLALMGLAEGPIFPSLVSVTPRHLPSDHVDNAIGFEVAAASLGGAALSGLAGVLARWTTLEVIGPFLFCWAVVMVVLHEGVLRASIGAGPESVKS